MSLAFWMVILGLAPLGLGLLVFLLPSAAWAGMTRRGSRLANQASTGALLIFSGLGLLGFMVLGLYSVDAWKGWRSTQWTTVEATVLESRLVETRQIRSTSPAWRPEVVYSYEVNGVAHRGSRVDFAGTATPDREWAEEMLRSRFEPGARVTAHVNPSDPAESVIETGAQGKALILVALGLAFAIIGVWQVAALARDWHGDRLVPKTSDCSRGGAGEKSLPESRWGWALRALAALGIALPATLTGCVAAALMLTLIAVFYEGFKVLNAVSVFVYYGLLFGWMFAWPATLVVLPGLWIFFPNRNRRAKRRALWCGGALSGGLSMVWLIARGNRTDGIGWTLIAAGMAGGLVAGMIFGLFVPRETRASTALRSQCDAGEKDGSRDRGL